ncbi:MAG: ATP-dependent DNA ligase [Candidatus Woesearchaeota archaeon]
MEYSVLVDYYEKLESTTKRLEKTYLLYKFLKSVPKEELDIATLLIQGKIFPIWVSSELGFASKLIIKAISLSTGYEQEIVEEEWREFGDLGLVAEALIKEKKQKTLFQEQLTLKKVFENLQKIAFLEGEKSVDLKVRVLSELLTSAKPREAKYLIRTTLGQLRVGIGEGTLRDAIAWALFPKVVGIFFKCENCKNWIPKSEKCPECGFKNDFKFNHEIEKFNENNFLEVDSYEELKNVEIKDYDFIICRKEKNARKIYNYLISRVENAYNMLADFSLVAKEASNGLQSLRKISLQPGRPVKVMLAIKTPTIKEGFERVGRPAQLEYKYDGFRIHIHKDKNLIKIFTRRLEDVTKQFPDIVEGLEDVEGESYILDGEAVGINKATGKYLPFQAISQRIKRKYDIEQMRKEFPVEVELFDILYYNGESLLKKPLSERRVLLEKIVHPKKLFIKTSKKLITGSEQEAQEFFKQALLEGNEGIMMKKLDAPYRAGARVGFMVKYKQVMENLDLVIVAAEWGEGKRSKWLSSYYVACRDENNNLLEIGKVATGLKEKEEQGLSFEELTKILKPMVIEQKGRFVRVNPEIVVEVAYEEIQKSPEYNSGFALRFPRIIRLRPDKPLDEISDLKRIKELFEEQRYR